MENEREKMSEKGLQDRIASKNEKLEEANPKKAHKMMKKTFCTLINLKIEAAACNGTLLFAEDLAIEIACRKYLKLINSEEDL